MKSHTILNPSFELGCKLGVQLVNNQHVQKPILQIIKTRYRKTNDSLSIIKVEFRIKSKSSTYFIHIYSHITYGIRIYTYYMYM